MLDMGRKFSLTLMLIITLAACTQTPQLPSRERHIQANVLMTYPELVAANQSVMRDWALSQDSRDFFISFDTNEPMSFAYKDPQGRFELIYPSIGSPANFTALMLTRSTRLGVDTLALKQVEFVLSDGETLRLRAKEALALRAYLAGRDFVPVSYDGFEFKAGEEKIATLEAFVERADLIDMSAFGGGLNVFTLQRDEILFGLSIVPQLYTRRNDDYTLHFFVAEKEDGIEY